MIKNTINTIAAVTSLNANNTAIKIPAIVAPNIGMSEKINAIATVGNARFIGIAGKKKCSANTTSPAHKAPTLDTAS